jgi:hypothetical protein
VSASLLFHVLVFGDQLVQHEVGEDVVFTVKVEIALRASGTLIQTPTNAFVAKAVPAFGWKSRTYFTG